MHIAVTIVGFRNPRDIVGCLTALAHSHHHDFEVAICENGGAEAFAELSSQLPRTLPGGQRVRAICAPANLGYADGVNRCIALSAEADAWLILNPDTLPEPDSLLLMARRLEVGDCEAVGCTIRLPDGRVQSHGGRWEFWWSRAVSLGHGSVGRQADVDDIERRQNYLNGACMLVSRRFVERAGRMRSDYFLYCEEVEWCLRARRLGLRLGYAPGAFVTHLQGTTTGSAGEITQRSWLSVYLNARNQILLARDLYRARLPLIAIGALAALAGKYLRRGAWRQFRDAIAGWCAGLNDERGPPAHVAELTS